MSNELNLKKQKKKIRKRIDYQLKKIKESTTTKLYFANKFINLLMKNGKKLISEKIVYHVFTLILKKTKRKPLNLFFLALKHIAPVLIVKSIKNRNRTYQVPCPLKKKKQLLIGLRWLDLECQKKSNSSIIIARTLSEQIIFAVKKKGFLIQKKLDSYKLAKLNRPFIYYRWF